MGYKLLIVESPKKSKTISKILGDNYLLRPTVGHINDLAKTGKYNLGIDIENGFKLKYAILPDKVDKVEAIVHAAMGADEVLIASDPDREGEAIAFAVAEQIADLNKPVKRVLFHEITKEGVKKGISNPIPLNNNLNEAQQARRAIDRIVGFMVSNQLKAYYSIANPEISNPSAGRVQSVALRLIADREKEIINFKPEVYYNIICKVKKDSEFLIKNVDKITDIDLANRILGDIKDGDLNVIKLNSTVKKVNPLPPLTTSKLQRYASTRLKFPVDKTMKIAQSLYEGGYITYLRTDSVRSSPEAIAELREYLKSNDLPLSAKENVYTTSGSQDAHEAIRPTDVRKTPNKILLDSEEAALYGLIWQFFVASQMEPIEYNITKADILAGGHLFRAAGKMLKSSGWSKILPDDSVKDDIILPLLNKGDSIDLVEANCHRLETKPPSRFNDGTLIDELEKRGIGRPSTFAAIISKITSKRYIVKDKQAYKPSSAGMEIIELLCKYYSFMDIDYTKRMEDSLDLIASGEESYIGFVSKFFSEFKNELKVAYESSSYVADVNCLRCNGHTVLRNGMYGHYVRCLSCGFAKNAEFVDGVVRLVDDRENVVVGQECGNCGGGMIEKLGRFGPYYGCINYPECNGTKKIPFGKKCSSCSSGELYMVVDKGVASLKCMDCDGTEEIPEGWEIKHPRLYGIL